MDVSRQAAAVGPWLAVEHALHGLPHYQPLCRVNGVPWVRGVPHPRVADINMAQLSRAASCSRAPSSCPATFAGNWSRGPGSATIGPEYLWEKTSWLLRRAGSKSTCTAAPNQFSTNFICSKYIGHNLKPSQLEYKILLHSVTLY